MVIKFKQWIKMHRIGNKRGILNNKFYYKIMIKIIIIIKSI